MPTNRCPCSTFSIRADILDLLRRLSERLGFSCLYVSHDLSILSNIADRLMVMYLGTTAEIGPVRDVATADPRHPYARALWRPPAPDPRYRWLVPGIGGDIAEADDLPPRLPLCRPVPACGRHLPARSHAAARPVGDRHLRPVIVWETFDADS
ncbi:MAG: hypothetical protein R3D03_07790 [Geminicoccaceae bacterium]